MIFTMFQRRRPLDFLIVFAIMLIGVYVLYRKVLDYNEEKMERHHQLLASTPFVQYARGEVGIILSIPHEGLRQPEGWPKRRHGCAHENFQEQGCFYNSSAACLRDAFNCEADLMPDSFTREIGLKIAEIIEKAFGKPHLIIFNIKRQYVDVNRNIDVGCQANEECIEVYNRFDEQLMAIKRDFEMQNKRGLFIDLHGQTHYHDMVELGMTVHAQDIIKARDDASVLTSERVRRKSSVFRLLSENKGIELTDLWGGHAYSMGSLLKKDGFNTLPMAEHPYVDRHHGGVKKTYFGGGRLTQMMGSANDALSALDAVQVEAPASIRNSRERRTAFAKSMANAIIKFYTNFY